MKKDEIIIARIFSIIAASAVMLLILLVFVRNGMFDGIAAKMNDNVEQFSDGQIYSMYYYKGLGVVYKILHSLTIFAILLTIITLFFRKKNAGGFALFSSYMAVITGAFIVLCRIFERNVMIHRLFAKMYLNTVGEVKTVHLLGLSWISGIVLVLLGSFCIAVIKISRIHRLKIYGGTNLESFAVFIPVIFGSVYMEFIRPLLVRAVVGDGSASALQYAFVYVKDYYLSDSFIFNLSFIFALMLTLAGVMLLPELLKNVQIKYLDWFVPVAVTLIEIIGAVVFYFNSPPLFGYFTYNESLCDAMELVGMEYIILYIFDTVFLMILLKGILQKKYSLQKTLTALLVNLAVSAVVIVIVSRFAGFGILYIGCIIADICALAVCLFDKKTN
jgi:hypothetical protein